MPPLAIKLLSASDLTFFKWQYENSDKGNQKAINLNSDVFVDVLFPSIRSVAPSHDGKFPVDTFLYGPGLRGEYNLQRKIVKHGTYKNWRLNGEFVFNPTEEPERFNSLKAGDCAVFEFGSTAITHPDTVKIVFIARNEREDEQLHSVLMGVLGSSSMTTIGRNDLERLLSPAILSEAHPLRELLLESAIEDAVQGGDSGMSRLLGRRSGRSISRPELQRAREKVELTGRLGEEFVDTYLSRQVEAGLIEEYVWDADVNAISPYDFRLVSEGVSVKIEVKSTTGEFDRPFHMSSAELRVAGNEPDTYRLFRVFELTEDLARVRISSDMPSFARQLLTSFSGLPKGVTVDSVSIDPSLLSFGAPIEIPVYRDEAREFSPITT